MVLQTVTALRRRTEHPLATELALVVVVLGLFYLWRRIVRTAASPVIDALAFVDRTLFESLLFQGLVFGGVQVVGLCLVAGLYVWVHDVDVGLSLPARSALPTAAAALAFPAVLVGVTKLVGVLTGVQYNALTMTSVAADAPLEPVLVVTGLSLFVGVPTYLLLCQVVVQGSFERVVDGTSAVVLTTLVSGFVLVNGGGGLSPLPELGKVVGALLFVLALGLALYARDRVEDRRLRTLASVPAGLFVTLVALSAVAEVGSVAEGVYGLTQLSVLAVAAESYRRTESLLVPALAYLSFGLTSDAVVVFLEAGLQSW